MVSVSTQDKQQWISTNAIAIKNGSKTMVFNLTYRQIYYKYLFMGRQFSLTQLPQTF